jgi:hypothetical protein
MGDRSDRAHKLHLVFVTCPHGEANFQAWSGRFRGASAPDSSRTRRAVAARWVFDHARDQLATRRAYRTHRSCRSAIEPHLPLQFASRWMQLLAGNRRRSRWGVGGAWMRWRGAQRQLPPAALARCPRRSRREPDLIAISSSPVRIKREPTRLEKKAKKGHRGYPVATVAYYGPDASRASKVAVGVILAEHAEVADLKRWSSETADVRTDRHVNDEILRFIQTYQVRTVAMTPGLIGCPHEEGVDYPEGEVCPQCPYWADRDRWTGDKLPEN